MTFSFSSKFSMERFNLFTHMFADILTICTEVDIFQNSSGRSYPGTDSALLRVPM